MMAKLTTRLNDIAAHLDSLHSLLICLAQANEGHEAADLLVAGSFYAVSNSVRHEQTALDAVIEELEAAQREGGAS